MKTTSFIFGIILGVLLGALMHYGFTPHRLSKMDVLEAATELQDKALDLITYAKEDSLSIWTNNVSTKQKEEFNKYKSLNVTKLVEIVNSMDVATSDDYARQNVKNLYDEYETSAEYFFSIPAE